MLSEIASIVSDIGGFMWRPVLPIIWLALGVVLGWFGNIWWPRLTGWFVGTVGVVLLGLLSFITVGSAQHVHKDGQKLDDELGEFYASWQKPDKRFPDGRRYISCCSKNDCEPAEIVAKNGKLYVRNHKLRPGEDVEIPPHLLEHNQPDPKESPDGRNHACVNYSGVLCVSLGAGG